MSTAPLTMTEVDELVNAARLPLGVVAAFDGREFAVTVRGPGRFTWQATVSFLDAPAWLARQMVARALQQAAERASEVLRASN